WFSYKGERVGQGRENARTFLKENKDITAKIEVEVRKALGLVKEPTNGAAEKPQAPPPPPPPAARTVAMPAARR
ncbi:MAG TPA: DNA recombination/repair protein RecA, partial [Terriglobales bacterium]|nr:DNA recombination/repair protein RecA [Terriglobales bacterium]